MTEKRLKYPTERFERRVNRPTDPDACWLWVGSVWRRESDGLEYGQFWPDGRAGGKQYAHRWAYENYVGPIPEGLTIDHLCRNTLCVNPLHLEPVTIGVNLRRSRGWAQNEKGEWACSQGHLVDEALDRGGCRECFNEYKREWRKNNPHDRERDNARRRGNVEHRSRENEQRHRAKQSAFLLTHPDLEGEMGRLGLVTCARRVRNGWLFLDGRWWKPMD